MRLSEKRVRKTYDSCIASKCKKAPPSQSTVGMRWEKGYQLNGAIGVRILKLDFLPVALLIPTVSQSTKCARPP